jgi:hypothetical protein
MEGLPFIWELIDTQKEMNNAQEILKTYKNHL